MTINFSLFNCRRMTLLALLVGLGACSATTPKSTHTSAPVVNTPAVALTLTFPQLLDQAELAENNGQAFRRNQYLLQAAELANTAQQCQHVHSVLAPIYPLLFSEQLAQAKLYRAQCVHPDDTYQTRLALLEAPTSSSLIQQQQWHAKAAIYEALFDARNAVNAHVTSQDYDINYVWRLAQKIPGEQLQLIGNSEIDGFIRLTEILREHALNQYELASQLTQFQYQFPNHPLVRHLPAEIIGLLQIRNNTAQRVAVLLPLTGRLAAQAQQIKQGVVAAYLASQSQQQGYEQMIESLYFVDTNTQTDEALIAAIAEADLIIGPLLKPKLKLILPHIKPNQQLLGLNRLDNDSLVPQLDTPASTEFLANTSLSNQTFFALSPEDEAEQIAEFMFTQQYQQPILIHAPDRTATRMAEAFTARWEALTQHTSTITLSFSDNKSMRKAIGDALGVQQSRDRISILERYLGQEMFSVTRNRKDIDAFVVFANAKQTELINPMIEASISTFSDDIQPVFASSRSYNHKLNKNSLRDLQNVIFIDMPWLLDETLNVELLTQYETVFGEASTAQKRLFAFGYDALNLIGKIQPLQKVQGLLLPGLTGSLAINNKNQVTRTLPRAKITTRQIERLTSE
ncbi:penicillin-binding protein activator [Glaciecola sp.]|nr:penicillin-binding protein activator [Glaciecola sp.]